MYKEYPPCSLLAPYIDKYWEFQGTLEYGTRMNILADGFTDFIFTLGNATETVNGSMKMQPYHSYFVGPMHTYSELIIRSESIHMVGIRFPPNGLSYFMKLPLHELGNMRISVNELNSIFDDSFAEMLAEQPGIQQRITLIEDFLLKHLFKNDPISDPSIAYAINQINIHKGKLPINHLMNDICLCQRHFERKFKMQTGYSPKKYSSIIKFKNAIELLRDSSFDNLLSVAVRAGYYDVSHLSREVRNLSGSTPYSFLSIPHENEISLIYME